MVYVMQVLILNLIGRNYKIWKFNFSWANMEVITFYYFILLEWTLGKTKISIHTHPIYRHNA